MLGKTPHQVTPEEICRGIASLMMAEKIKPIRSTFERVFAETGGDWKAAKEAVDPLKKELPAFQWCGIFYERGNGHCEKYSGYLCADLDKLTTDEVADLAYKMDKDPHIHCTAISPSGHGLKPVFAVSPRLEDHEGNYLAVEKYVRETYGYEIDAACRNVERLCFGSYDEYLPMEAGCRAARTRKQRAQCQQRHKVRQRQDRHTHTGQRPASGHGTP